MNRSSPAVDHERPCTCRAEDEQRVGIDGAAGVELEPWPRNKTLNAARSCERDPARIEQLTIGRLDPIAALLRDPRDLDSFGALEGRGARREQYALDLSRRAGYVVFLRRARECGDDGHGGDAENRQHHEDFDECKAAGQR